MKYHEEKQKSEGFKIDEKDKGKRSHSAKKTKDKDGKNLNSSCKLFT